MAVVGSIAALVLLLVVGYISTSNDEISTRQEVKAQQKNVAVVFDNTWKILQQQAGVSDEYKNSFMEIYPKLMEGRYGNARGGALMSWIQEANPNFDTSLYKKLMDSIEIQRTTFTREQTHLIDLQREHTTKLQTFPGSIFLAGRQPEEIKLVTSAKTEAAFQSGQDNDVDLFKKEKQPTKER